MSDASEPHPLHIRTNTRRMTTRAKDGIVYPRLHPTLLLYHAEPKIEKQAMKAEFDALIKNGTWTLVSMPPQRTPIGCK